MSGSDEVSIGKLFNSGATLRLHTHTGKYIYAEGVEFVGACPSCSTIVLICFDSHAATMLEI